MKILLLLFVKTLFGFANDFDFKTAVYNSKIIFKKHTHFFDNTAEPILGNNTTEPIFGSDFTIQTYECTESDFFLICHDFHNGNTYRHPTIKNTLPEIKNIDDEHNNITKYID